MSANLGASFAMSQLQFWGVEMDKLTISVDESGWPVSAARAGMKKPLFTFGISDFVSVIVNSFVPRWGGKQSVSNCAGHSPTPTARGRGF